MLNKYPLLPISVRNGVIGGVVAVMLFVGLYFIGPHPFIIAPYMDFRIILFTFFLFITLREFREDVGGGVLFFWQGMTMSLVLTILFVLIGMLSIWLFATLQPEFVTSYVALKTRQAQMLPPEIVAQYGKERIDAVVKALPATRPFDLALVYVWTSCGISFFISVILSVILRRQPTYN